jgi:hypothetical protein
MMFSTDAQSPWRMTILSNGPRHYFLMAIIFNVLNLMQLGWVFKLYRDVPYLGLFLILIVFLLMMLAYYAVSFYRQTHDRLKSLPEDSPEGRALQQLTYAGYRLYLMGLGIGFVVLGFFNLIRR